MNRLDSIATVWLALLGAMAFIAFGYDKWGAGHSRRRVPERVLVLLAAFGGWPGGLLGMMVFRHKTAKSTFKLKYALALLPFAAGVWAWWHWR